MTIPAAEFELGDIIQSMYSHREARSPTRMGAPGQGPRGGVEHAHGVTVGLGERVGGDHRGAEHPASRLDVVRVGVGQRLEQRESHDDLADTADVLLLVAAMLGVARCRRVGEIQHGDAVAVQAAAEQRGDLRGERGVGRGQVEGLALEAQVHLAHPEAGTAGLRHVPDHSLDRQGDAEETADARLRIAVERVGGGGTRRETDREAGREQPDAGERRGHRRPTWGAPPACRRRGPGSARAPGPSRSGSDDPAPGGSR